MTNAIRSAVAAFFAVGVLCASAAVHGTNTWIGASSGGSWKTASNWKSVTSAGVENPDPTTTFNDASYYVYDFSALANGATVQNDCPTKIRIVGLLFGDNQGTVTLARSGGQDAYFNKSGGNLIHVGTGTTVSFNLQHSGKWQDDGSVLNFEGGGDFQFAMNDLGLAGGAQFNLNGGTTVSIMKTPANYSTGFYLTQINFQDDDSVLNIKADNVRFQVIKSASGKKGRVALNGHTAGIVYGGGTSIAEVAFGGYFDGPGTLYVQGGNALKFTNAEAFRNGAVLKVRTDEVTLGAGAALGAGTALEMADNGRVAISESATVKQLKGGGTMGAVTVASGKTLTVGTSASTGGDTYSARIVGDGKLIKDGSGYTLRLDGVNTYQGGTEVKAGTLEIAAAAADPVPDGLVAYYKFDEADAIGKDSSGRGKDLNPRGTVTCSAGVVGGAAHLTKQSQAGAKNGASLVSGTLNDMGWPIGSAAISFSYWIRITDPFSGDIQLSLYGQWTGGGAMYLMRGNTNGYLNFSSADSICNLSYVANIADGQWHHVAGTYDGNHNRKLYVNGQLVRTGKDADGTSMNIDGTKTFEIGTSEDRSFTGDVDEYRIYDRALSDGDVQKLYKTCLAQMAIPAARPDAAASLPAPVAKYTFDDSANEGKDTSGNGYDLTKVGVTTYAASRKGAYGGCVKLGTTAYFKADTFPAKVPTSGSFTLSLRVQPAQVSTPAYVFWGKANSTAAYSFFWAGANNNQLVEQVGSFTTNNDLMDDELFSTAGGASSSTGNEATWINIVYVYSYDKKTLSAYRDGNLVMSKSNYASTFAASPEVFYLGYSPIKNTYAACYLDDVRIFDEVLSPSQVKTLVRSLETGSAGAPLPSAGTVKVEPGATLKTIGVGNVIPSLSGAGTLDVGYFGSTTVGDPSGFSGAVTGLGSLYVGGSFGNSDLSGFGGFVSLADGFNVTTDNDGRNLPAVSRLTGAVTIPSTGTLTLAYDDPTDLTTKTFVIAEAKEFVSPSDFSGWHVAPVNDFYHATFLVEEGDGVKRFVAKMKYKRGFMAIIR